MGDARQSRLTLKKGAEKIHSARRSLHIDGVARLNPVLTGTRATRCLFRQKAENISMSLGF